MGNKKTGEIQGVTRGLTGLFVNFRKGKLDGRTRLGKTAKFLEAKLIEHCGGPEKVSIPQKLLIDRVVWKAIRCKLYEITFFQGSHQESSRDHYLALANSLRLDLQSLGLKSNFEKVLSLEEYLRKKGHYEEEDEGEDKHN